MASSHIEEKKVSPDQVATTYAYKLKRKNDIKLRLNYLLSDLIDIILSYDEYYSYQDAIKELGLEDYKQLNLYNSLTLIDRYTHNIDEKNYTVSRANVKCENHDNLRGAYLSCIKLNISNRYDSQVNSSLEAFVKRFMHTFSDLHNNTKYLFIFKWLRVLSLKNVYRCSQTDRDGNVYLEENMIDVKGSVYTIIGIDDNHLTYWKLKTCQDKSYHLNLQYQINPLRHKLQHMSKFMRVVFQIKYKLTEQEVNGKLRCHICGNGLRLKDDRSKICTCDLDW